MEAEDLERNPFFVALRTTYQALYERACRSGEETVILIPAASSLDDPQSIPLHLIEAHILRASHSTGQGIFVNLSGQGVEIKDGSVSTSQGFEEHRMCTVIQQESMYEWDNTFRVLIIDIPIIGKYKNTARRARRDSFDAVEEWINTAPEIENDLFEVVNHFRQSYVQVPGFEYETGKRIERMCEMAAKKLRQFHNIQDPYQEGLLRYTVSKTMYAALHSFLFPHLVYALQVHEERLSTKMGEFSIDGLVDTLLKKDIWITSEDDIKSHIIGLEEVITPHEKLDKIVSLFNLIHRMEVTGDDVLILFALGIRTSGVRNILAHVAHMDLFLKASKKTIKKFHETDYAFTSFQSAVSYLLSSRNSVVAISASSQHLLPPQDEKQSDGSEGGLPRLRS